MERKQEFSAPESLAKGVAGLIDAVIGVGAAVAKATAEVTARGAECPKPETGAGSFSALVHYSVVTAGNLISLVSAATGAAGKVNRTKATSKTPAGAVPRVRLGAKLRVPLSVENTSDRPMTRLSPRLRRLLIDGVEKAGALPSDAVEFTPKTFTVSAKDFEKLTVTVTVPETAAAGSYDLILGLGPSEPDFPLSFEVIPPVAG